MMSQSSASPGPDLSHHLSTLSKSRHASPLKDIIKYMYEPEMTSLAGGLPNPSLFPFLKADIEILDANVDLSPADTSRQDAVASHHLRIDRNGSSSDNTLSRAMQYTGGSGDQALTQLCHDFVKQVYKPARGDSQVLLSTGNTDAWAKVVQLLCEPGEHILVEQVVYPSAQHFYIPMGCKGVPIKMDGDGILPEALEKILEEWDKSHPDIKRPHVLYQVPVGQNPSGSTLTWERKQRVYELAVKYDLIIVEDDREPRRKACFLGEALAETLALAYYFLQFEPYLAPTKSKTANGPASELDRQATPLDLIPSYIQLDTQGRVIRLETFSKTIAPGLRLGFFVASPPFTERLLRATEVSSQAPSGWSQAILLELLRKWGTDGYLTWLASVKTAYLIRRNWMCDALFQNLDFDSEWHAEQGYIARVSNKTGSKVPALSFVPPKAGMFVWITLHLADNPAYKVLRQKMDGPSAVAQWSHDFWLHLIERKVLLTPGSYYEPWQGSDVKSSVPDATAFFRLAYSYESQADIEGGIRKLALALTEAWKA